MVIRLYKTADDPRKGFKTLTEITGVSGISANPKAGFSMLSPVLVIDYDASYLGANYCYIADFDRYYTIGEPSVYPAQCIVIPCTVDPIMSAYGSLTSSENPVPITVLRSESAGINIIPDDKLPIIPNVKDVTSTILTSSFFTKTDTNSYLLSVIGDD